MDGKTELLLVGGLFAGLFSLADVKWIYTVTNECFEVRRTKAL